MGYAVRRSVVVSDWARAAVQEECWYAGYPWDDFTPGYCVWEWFGLSPSLSPCLEYYESSDPNDYCVICVTTPESWFRVRNLIRRLQPEEYIDLSDIRFDPRMIDPVYDAEEIDTASLEPLGWDGASAWYASLIGDMKPAYPWDETTEAGALRLFATCDEAEAACDEFNQKAGSADNFLFPAKIYLVRGPRPRFIRSKL